MIMMMTIMTMIMMMMMMINLVTRWYCCEAVKKGRA